MTEYGTMTEYIEQHPLFEIESIDEYIEMWNDNLLSSQGCADLTNALIAEVKRLRDAIADIAIDMEAADESYMGGFIEDLRKVIE
tara:strand:+ start:118 stop:372 length:255 start_codon:yes stop_codon:yes gene_type:complete